MPQVVEAPVEIETSKPRRRLVPPFGFQLLLDLYDKKRAPVMT